jgi:pimeloyl-ACP methyl ester carboxylesterase
MPDRDARYCTSADGTRIAYTVFGEGPALLMCPGTWESFANQNPEMSIYETGLWHGRTVIRYDFRGVGLSQRHANDYSLDRQVEDIEAVSISAQLGRFALFGSQFSAPAAAVFAARHAERVTRLILSRLITSSAEVMPRENLEALVGLIRANWEMASQAISDLGIRAGDSTAGIRVSAMLRQNMEPDALAGMLSDLYRTIDVKDILKDILCPTLIVHRREDTVFPFAAVQHAAATIENSRLLPLPGSGPPSFGDDGEVAVRAEIAFLDEDPETRALPNAADAPPVATPASAFRTILFTDLVGHTQMMSRLGDEAGRAVLREHEDITRTVLKANGGTEVKTMGDGFMASFGSVTKAVECAIALQQAIEQRNSQLSTPNSPSGSVSTPASPSKKTATSSAPLSSSPPASPLAPRAARS